MLRQRASSSPSAYGPQENGILPNADGRVTRLVNKEGEFHVSLEKIGCKEKFRRYIGDCFTTFIDLKWRWTLLVIVSGYFLTWLVFATVYFIFGLINNDMAEISNGKPCVSNVKSFTSALLFSVESQHTIGYGYRSVTEHCPHVITVVFFQFIFGVGIQCLIAGLFFAKLQRAKKRSETIMFSKTACISRFNGKVYLSVRVGNLRSSLLLGVRAMGMLVKKRHTPDGTEIPLTQHHIDFFNESQCDSISLLWPAIIYHPIDEQSPLCNTSQDEVLSGYSELIVVLEGVTDSTSKTFQARTSYLPPEVNFNYRFTSIAPTLNSDNVFQISYFDFNIVTPTDVKPRRLLELRDSASQTVNTGDVHRSNVEHLKNWRSVDDVRHSHTNLKKSSCNGSTFMIDSHGFNHTSCPPGLSSIGNLYEQYKPDCISYDYEIEIDNSCKSLDTEEHDQNVPDKHDDQVTCSHSDQNYEISIPDSQTSPDAKSTANHTIKDSNYDNNNSVLEQGVVDQDCDDAVDASILKQTPSGSKIFKVLKLTESHKA